MILRYWQGRKDEHRIYISGRAFGSLAVYFEPDANDMADLRIYSKFGFADERQMVAINEIRTTITKKLYRNLNLPRPIGQFPPVPFIKLVEHAVEHERTLEDWAPEAARELHKASSKNKHISPSKRR